MKPQPCWYLYLIECRDGSLYTGITVDVERRYAQHVAGTGARYTRSHPPLRLLGHCVYPDRGQASSAEYRIKQLTPTQKRLLCSGWRAEVPDRPQNNTPRQLQPPASKPPMPRHAAGRDAGGIRRGRNIAAGS